MPKVSVVILTFNRATLLGRALKSVLDQSFQDFELIVVDDGSTDSTVAVAKKNDFADDSLSRIKEVEEAYENDPLNLKKFYFSLAGNMMVGGVRYLNKNIKSFQTPVLFLHGEADKIVPVEFSKRLYDLVPVEDKQIITYPDSYHEILNDLDQELVRKDIVKWLDKKTKGVA